MSSSEFLWLNTRWGVPVKYVWSDDLRWGHIRGEKLNQMPQTAENAEWQLIDQPSPAWGVDMTPCDSSRESTSCLSCIFSHYFFVSLHLHIHCWCERKTHKLGKNGCNVKDMRMALQTYYTRHHQRVACCRCYFERCNALDLNLTWGCHSQFWLEGGKREEGAWSWWIVEKCLNMS